MIKNRYIVRVLTAEFWNPLPIHVQTTRHLEFKSISPRHIWSDINPMHCYASIPIKPKKNPNNTGLRIIH